MQSIPTRAGIKTWTHFVISEVDVLLLGTRALDILGKGEETDEEEGSASSKDSRRHTLLRANLGVGVIVANTAGGSPLLLRGDGVVL